MSRSRRKRMGLATNSQSWIRRGPALFVACCRRTREYIWLRAPIARAPIGEGVNRPRQERRGVQSLTGSLAQNLRFPGHISWSTFGKPMLNVVPDRGADAVWASEAPSKMPACITTGTGTTIPPSAATPSPTRSASSMVRACTRMRRVIQAEASIGTAAMFGPYLGSSAAS